MALPQEDTRDLKPLDKRDCCRPPQKLREALPALAHRLLPCTRVQVRVGHPHFVLVTSCPLGGRTPDGVPPASEASSPPPCHHHRFVLEPAVSPGVWAWVSHLRGVGSIKASVVQLLDGSPVGFSPVFTNPCLTPVRLRHPSIPTLSLDGVTVLLLCQDCAAWRDLKPAAPDSYGGRQLLGSLERRPRTRVSTSLWTWPGCPDPPAATGPGDRPSGAGSLGDSAPGRFGEQSESSLWSRQFPSDPSSTLLEGCFISLRIYRLGQPEIC